MAVNNPHIQRKRHLSIHLCHPENLKFGCKGLHCWAPNRKILGSTIKREIWSLGSQQERQPRTGSLVVGQSTYQLTPGIAVLMGCFSWILLAEFVRWQKSRNHSLNIHRWILLSIMEVASGYLPLKNIIISLYNTIALLFHKYGLNRTSWYVEWRIEGFTTKIIKTESSKICLQENSWQILSQLFAFSRLGLASGLGSYWMVWYPAVRLPVMISCGTIGA